jgi:DNA (cytosine-5)-methyltransferase 1
VRELALFTGAGGGLLGSHILGWKTVCAVEIEKYPRSVLLARQRDGILDRFPIWDDIRTFDGTEWRGRCDIITGGFPCQDISTAGKGAGIYGKKSGLWRAMAWVVHEVRPRFVFVENSPALTGRGLNVVLRDLAEMGYNARWCVLGADDAGAPHRRKRIWILAYTDKERPHRSGQRSKQTGRGKSENSCKISDSNNQGLEIRKSKRKNNEQKQPSFERIYNKWWQTDPADVPHASKKRLEIWSEKEGRPEGLSKQPERSCIKIPHANLQQKNGRYYGRMGRQWQQIQRYIEGERPIKPGLGRVAHGVAHRVDRIKSIGNGQVPAVAALAFIILSEGLI